MACDDVDILTSEVTYTWNNDAKECTESTVIDTSGVDGAAVTKMVNKDLCCVSGTEAMPQDATLMMACPVVTTTVTHTWVDTGKECKQSTVITTDTVDGTPSLADVNAAVCCVVGT